MRDLSEIQAINKKLTDAAIDGRDEAFACPADCSLEHKHVARIGRDPYYWDGGASKRALSPEAEKRDSLQEWLDTLDRLDEADRRGRDNGPRHAAGPVRGEWELAVRAAFLAAIIISPVVVLLSVIM